MGSPSCGNTPAFKGSPIQQQHPSLEGVPIPRWHPSLQGKAHPNTAPQPLGASPSHRNTPASEGIPTYQQHPNLQGGPHPKATPQCPTLLAGIGGLMASCALAPCPRPGVLSPTGTPLSACPAVTFPKVTSLWCQRQGPVAARGTSTGHRAELAWAARGQLAWPRAVGGGDGWRGQEFLTAKQSGEENL